MKSWVIKQMQLVAGSVEKVHARFDAFWEKQDALYLADKAAYEKKTARFFSMIPVAAFVCLVAYFLVRG
jgi:hypothetical protein